MKYIKLNEKYAFSESLLETIKSFKDTNKKELVKEKKQALKDLKFEYKNLLASLKVEVKTNIGQVKSKYADLKVQVEEDYSKNIAELNALPRNSKEEKHHYNELLSGVNIKRKRALKNQTKDRIQEEIDCKRALTELRFLYANTRKDILGKNNFFFNLVTERIEERNANSIEKNLRDREFWTSKISIFSFLFLVIVYCVLCLIGGTPIQYERILTDSSIIIAVALGGVFIYSMRSFDMSLGGGTAVAAVCGAMVWNATHSLILVLLVAMLIGIVIELINSALASVLKLPVMVTTLAMSSVLGAILTNILDGTTTQTVKVKGISGYDTFWFYLLVIIALFIVTAYIFKVSPVGRRNKMIGANSTSSRFSGINIRRQGLITFFIAGIAVGVGAMLYIVNARIVNDSSCSTIGLDVILAIVFGGMQTTGGPKSKISAAITGGLTATLISYTLIALARVSGVPEIVQYESLVKGILFLTIVSVNTIGNRSNRLPAIEMLW